MPVAPLPARWLPDFQKRAAALRVVLGAPLRITGSFR